MLELFQSSSFLEKPFQLALSFLSKHECDGFRRSDNVPGRPRRRSRRKTPLLFWAPRELGSDNSFRTARTSLQKATWTFSAFAFCGVASNVQVSMGQIHTFLMMNGHRTKDLTSMARIWHGFLLFCGQLQRSAERSLAFGDFTLIFFFCFFFLAFPAMIALISSLQLRRQEKGK